MCVVLCSDTDSYTAPCIFSTTAKDRFTDEEKRALDRAQTYLYQEMRQAAEAHRQVCKHSVAQSNALFCFVTSIHFDTLQNVDQNNRVE